MRASMFLGCVLSLSSLALGVGCSSPAACGTSGGPCCTTGSPCQSGLECGTGVCGPSISDCNSSCNGRVACGVSPDLTACVDVCMMQSAGCQAAERALWDCAGTTSCTIELQQMNCASEFTAQASACGQP